jgi:hypothetical protein
MESNRLFEIIDRSLDQKLGKHFSDLERDVFLESWEGTTYEEMAHKFNHATGYLSRTVGPGLWDLLTKVLGETVTKLNFKWAVMRYIEAEESRQKLGCSSPVQESYEGVLTVYSEELEPHVNEEQFEPLASIEPNGQKIMCEIKAKTLQAGNLTQKSPRPCMQEILTGAQVEESIIIGDITQDAKSYK